jgi:Ca-activated chloride channel family protein
VVDLAPADYRLIMGAITLTAPSALWLLLLVPVIYLAHGVARTNFNKWQGRLQAVLRSFLLAALVLAFARPIVSTRSARQSIVYAVDVSHSVGTPAVEEAARRIDELNAALRPDHSRIVVFGATARTVDSTAALRQLAHLDAAAEDPNHVDRRGTDLEAALDVARGELATNHVPRVVLFSDGRPTAGQVRAAVARLALERIPVSVEPLAVRSLGDTWVASIDVPDRIHATASFPVTINIGSQREGTAVIELRSGPKVLAKQSASISRGGVTPVTIDAVVDAPGAIVLEAAVIMPGDPLASNDTLRRGVWVDSRVRVLYVEGTPASARYLSGALAGSGFDVTVRPPSGVPATAAGFDPYDVVVLSDVARAAIPNGAMAALPPWVERGGGLLVTGGEAVFGEGDGGYRRTPLEGLTPVTFERKDEPSLALVLVLDRSWSMAGSSMDLCKAAAQAAVDVMTEEQSVGILTFNDKFDWDVKVRNVGKNRDEIRVKIAAIEPGGRTLIFPALEQAYLALRSVKARAKHVVLLSDGRTYPDDYEALVRRMVDAKITVSSVAVGASADQELLRNIATWGKGQEYLVADPKELPQIFVKEAKNAGTPAFEEHQMKPVVKTAAFLSAVDLTRLPPLKGFTSTVMKDAALELLSTPDGDPLLAFWPVGLGRTAVFASDVKDRWGALWVQWRGYGPFFSAVVHALERQRPPAAALDVTPGPIRGATRSVAIAVEARDPEGGYRDLLHPAVRVRAGTGASRDVVTRQVAPGRYEATVVADAQQTLSVTMKGEGPGGNDEAGLVTRTIVPDPMAEYRFEPPDDALLKGIATATGGAWRPTPAALVNAAGDRTTDRRPMWPPLLALALTLWFVDLLFRRIRVFE